METEVDYTYATPELIQQTKYENIHKGCWFIARHSLEKDKETTYSESTQYLSFDGQWYGGMKINDQSTGGTYFKTLTEAIAVLAEFEIDVM